ncbi:putative epoxide hydrolase [Tricladium varicosporioides]|nr:putative epoxide hydrolase [Hymenoscyphus varicosporioides]
MMLPNDLNFRFPKTTSPRLFDIQVDNAIIKLAQRKARDYRSSDNVNGEWSREGPAPKAMTDLARYWATEYDWKAAEKDLNKHKHYTTTVPGNGNYSVPIPLHFVHEKSQDKNAIPLLLIHGWSSTHHEWSKVIDNLTNSSSRGNSFHIVAPDLPGYGFTPAPTQPGQGPQEVAAAFDALMKQLGYEKYAVATTDIGWIVGMWMTVNFRHRIIAHYTDFFFALPTSDDLARYAQHQTTQEENINIESTQAWFAIHSAYATAQAQKPQMLSVALTDSPVGFAGWLWDLKYGSSDGYRYTYDELITDTLLMWIQGPIGSIRGYSLFVQPSQMQFPITDVPTGVSQWGGKNGPFSEIATFPMPPPSWIERYANLVHFKRYDFGGHWPAISQPDLWVADLRTFFELL